jgi:hypothetical protein
VFVRKLALFFVCLFGVTAGSVHAQSEARIRVVAHSITQVEDDLKWLIELSPTPELKKQWKTLKGDLLDAFTQGVDENRPISMDLVFRKDEMSYEPRIPISNLTDKKKGFLQNLNGIGFNDQKMVSTGFYEIGEKKKKPFYLRYDKDYAWIATLKQSVPANPPAATADLQPLLDLQKDIIAELKNTADGLPVRRDNFKELRKQFEALIKLRRNEDPKVFELRKLSLIQQLEEAERFIVESETMQVNWTTSVPKASGRGEISVSALPGTDLQKSIEEFGAKPSYFSNVALHANPLVVGKLNFPLDALRTAHVKDFYKAVRPKLEAEIDARPAPATESQKTALKQAMNKFFDMLDAGAALGVVDSFADAHAVAAGKNVLICGIRAADGKVADEIVKLLPQFRSDWKVTPDAMEHAGVSIHELTVPKTRLDAFQKVFAGESVIYVGTSKDAVWGAAGVDAVTHLKAAIDQAAQPLPEQADPTVVSYRVQVAKLVQLMEIIQESGPVDAAAKPKDDAAPKTKEQKEEQQRQKEVVKYRKLAQDAMSGCESLMHGELKRFDNKVEGFIEMNECVLKYIGSVVADGVKQYLQ